MRWMHGLLLTGLVLMLSAFGCGAGGSAGGGNNGGASVPTFDQARAWAHLNAQVDFGPRHPGSDGHELCRQWLGTQLRAVSGDVSEQTFPVHAGTGQDFTGVNILATFPASRQTGGDTLLLGAHWDTRPVADEDPDPDRRGDPILGANDGASGVAVLLELARLFHANPPPRPIVVALFDWEDAGNTVLTAGMPLGGWSLGSQYFAANMGRFAPSEAIIVDMVGDRRLEILKERQSVLANPTLVNRIWSAAAAKGFTQFVNRSGGSITDDHVPLINAGVGAIDLIDLDYPGPNSNHFWHTHDDVPDNCDPESLRAVGQTILEVIYGR